MVTMKRRKLKISTIRNTKYDLLELIVENKKEIGRKNMLHNIRQH